MLFQEDSGEIYNPGNLHLDLNETMQSITNMQQSGTQQMGWGEQIRHEKEAQPSSHTTMLLPLGIDNQPMSIEDLEHAAAATAAFPWTTNTTLASGTSPWLSTTSDFPDTIISNSHLDTVLHDPYHHSQTDADGGNGIDNHCSQVNDSNIEGLVLGFDSLDSCLDGTKNGQLHSLLGQRTRRLGHCNPGGSVSIQGEGCDKEVLNYLLDVLMPIRPLVKISVSM